MPLIVKTHLDLRNDKCIKIYILESIEYSGGLFNIFIEIKLTNIHLFSCLFCPICSQTPFPTQTKHLST